jgi:asparagine synthetase B (glutamine-hydrolysing)
MRRDENAIAMHHSADVRAQFHSAPLVQVVCQLPPFATAGDRQEESAIGRKMHARPAKVSQELAIWEVNAAARKDIVQRDQLDESLLFKDGVSGGDID